MSFRLTLEQKANLQELGCFSEDKFDELIDILESHMSEAYVKEAGSQISPLLEARQKLNDIKRKAEKLSKDLESLTPNDQYRIKDLVGINYHENHTETPQSSRRQDLNVQHILASLSEAAEDLVEDSKTAYGSRSNDKPVLWLLEFWYEHIKAPIGPRSEKGPFVRFVAIILGKDPEAARKLVARLGQQQS